jgi:phospholipase C
VSRSSRNLQHIVVVMMSSRSFDHMLGGLKFAYPQINGLTGDESNPDTKGALVKVQPRARFQGQLIPDPDHHFAGVDLQIFGGVPAGSRRIADMQGFVRSYFQQTKDVNRSHNVMHYFPPDKLPVLTTLATEFAVFNGWFSSVPGPGPCNRAFAHYGTSFGQVGMEMPPTSAAIPSIYERMAGAGLAAKIYYYDETSSTLDTVNLLKNQPRLFGTFSQFLADCETGNLPAYSFVEPCHNHHTGPNGGMIRASDQHPDHDVREGERFIAVVYNAIRTNPEIWNSTVLLIVYDQHGGFYDHVVPPASRPDSYVANPANTGTGEAFAFDRLGVRVPAILVSPWIARGTVIPGPGDSTNGRIFEHASIPATIRNLFLPGDDRCTVRESSADTFLNVLTDQMRSDSDVPYFNLVGQPTEDEVALPRSNFGGGDLGDLEALEREQSERKSTPKPNQIDVPAAREEEDEERTTETQVGPSTHVARDRWTTNDSLGHFPYAYAIYRFLTDDKTRPPLAISIQAPWGGGKTSLMRMIQAQLDPATMKRAEQTDPGAGRESEGATVKDVLHELKANNTEKKGGVTAGHRQKDEPGRFTVPSMEGGGKRCVTIWFNAWKYESTAQVWAGLADCIVQQIGDRLGPVERELFWFRLQLRRLDAAEIRSRVYQEVFSRFLGKLLPWLWAYAVGPGIALAIAAIGHLRNWERWESDGWLGVFLALGGDLFAAWKQLKSVNAEVEKSPAKETIGKLVAAPDYKANLGFVHEVTEDLKRVFETIPRRYLPMVIFIDDLDRCSPGKVAAVVEAINLFLAGEFPDCMFVLGIDDEMVAAALDQAHGDVIAKLPGYAKAISLGWRFMDKFVQLPFIVPSSSPEELTRYVYSLFSEVSEEDDIDMETRDRAARVVEQSKANSATAEEVIKQVAAETPLAPRQQETLKRDVEAIHTMNENIKNFGDQEKTMRNLISSLTAEYFSNPRDVKRFVNLFRFYYFLRSAREARKEAVPSLEQMCRWLVFSLKWPEVVRWLRRYPSAQGAPDDSPLRVLEHLGATSANLVDWQTGADARLQLKVEQTRWLLDEDLWSFFRKEASAFAETERLSTCSKKGLW